MKKKQMKRKQRELIAEAKRLSSERNKLTDKMTAIDRRLTHIRHALEGLRALLSELPVSQMLPRAERVMLSPIDPGNSITRGIRQLFVHNPVLTGPLIRDAFKTAGFKKDDYTLLITIHNNLKRLAERGEIRAIRLGHRKVAYEKVDPLERVFGRGHHQRKTTDAVKSHHLGRTDKQAALRSNQASVSRKRKKARGEA